MSWNVQANQSGHGDDALYAQWGDRGLVFRLTPGGEIETQLRVPNVLDAMLTADEAFEELLERLADVPMPKAVRENIATKLGVDIEDVGCGQRRRSA